MKEYFISPDCDEKMFQKVSMLINSAEGIEKKELLIDADDTMIQCYKYKGRELDIYNDTEIGGIYIKSEDDISKLLAKCGIDFY
ncbi:MAG: hypothetical protein SOR92_07300 [Christensenella hongkongensis]|uniref:hypothetical protein n=1 Tax=Christensenella hongkongensis TaxID=270498 RepID=UPI002673203C|nr:hypothetical protein [Christensenella hongkongensis]MDY3004260.1 hypothetical protein [Christensenella hongkongensis]